MVERTPSSASDALLAVCARSASDRTDTSHTTRHARCASTSTNSDTDNRSIPRIITASYANTYRRITTGIILFIVGLCWIATPVRRRKRTGTIELILISRLKRGSGNRRP